MFHGERLLWRLTQRPRRPRGCCLLGCGGGGRGVSRPCTTPKDRHPLFKCLPPALHAGVTRPQEMPPSHIQAGAPSEPPAPRRRTPSLFFHDGIVFSFFPLDGVFYFWVTFMPRGRRRAPPQPPGGKRPHSGTRGGRRRGSEEAPQPRQGPRH